jgi:hypothetical protein
VWGGSDDLQIGASPAYEMFTGIVELTCGILLFIPGLTVAGAHPGRHDARIHAQHDV